MRDPCNAALFVLCAALSGCGGGHHAAQSEPASPPMFIEINGGNLPTIAGTNLGTDAFVVSVDNGVTYRYQRTSTSLGETLVEQTINGLPFEIDGLSMRIGSQSYGPFERGAQVTIMRSGVFVGETQVGVLPESSSQADP